MKIIRVLNSSHQERLFGFHPEILLQPATWVLHLALREASPPKPPREPIFVEVKGRVTTAAPSARLTAQHYYRRRLGALFRPAAHSHLPTDAAGDLGHLCHDRASIQHVHLTNCEQRDESSD